MIKYYNLTWNVSSFEERTLVLNVFFQDPIFISQGLFQKDNIKVTVLDPQFFRSSNGMKFHHPDLVNSQVWINKQIPKFGTTRSLIESTDEIVQSLNTFNAIQIVLNMIFQVSLSNLLALIGSLQILVFQLCLVRNWPVNLQTTLIIVMKVLNFEFIDPKMITDEVYDFEYDKMWAEYVQTYKPSDFNFHLVDLDFETFNPILNAGGLFILICLYSVLIVPFLILYLYVHLCMRKSDTEGEGGTKHKPKDLI